MPNNFLEIETKYEADNIDRLKFKELVNNLNPKNFVYIESTDVYYVKGKDEFLRYRKSADNLKDKRAELTFKKKHSSSNNIVRTEVNLRVDSNKPETVDAFSQGLGYTQNFSVIKYCDIYNFHEVTLVYYIVKDVDIGKYSKFIEIEVSEELNLEEPEAWEIIKRYEGILAPLGISAQKRKRKSLFELYRKEAKDESGKTTD